MKGFFLLMRSCLAHHLEKSYASARVAPTVKQRPLQSRDVHGNQSSGPQLNPGDWIGYLERKKTCLCSTSSSDCKAAASAKQRCLWKSIVRPMAQPRRLDRIFGEEKNLLVQLRLQSSGLCKAEMFMEIIRQAHGSTEAIE